tara:strand:- start:1994 stop:2200 length:207 start_codon:yes stop_codon:yes gene_type:complete
MPDLIIKPADTSGNKIKIQTYSGTTVLETSDTGVSLSNASLETTTTGKVKMKGSFMQSSTHQSLVLGG